MPAEAEEDFKKRDLAAGTTRPNKREVPAEAEEDFKKRDLAAGTTRPNTLRKRKDVLQKKSSPQVPPAICAGGKREVRNRSEWAYQWSRLEDRESWLFGEWIAPHRLEDFAGKTVLEAGCGPGHHARLAAQHARRVVALDLNTAAIARKRLKDLKNVEIQEGDIAAWDNGERFDVVYSIGVVHHTGDPDRTVAHLKTLVKPGGRLILWVYSREGNALIEHCLEPFKTLFVRRLPRPAVFALAHLFTLALYPVVYSLYLLPLPGLPFFEYFLNFRKLSYRRNFLNVFDKLNAPVTHFISRSQAERWLGDLKNPHLSRYVGVSWRISGTHA